MCVLIVDDEPLLRMLLRDEISEAGHNVLTAADPSDALAKLDKHPVLLSCLVTEVQMYTTVSGLKLAELIRFKYPEVPIIVATAFVDAAPAKWRKTFGIKLLEKPYSPQVLIKFLDCLNTKQVSRDLLAD